MSSVLEKLGFKLRVTAFNVDGYGELHLRDLTAGEWRECTNAEPGSRAAKIAALAIVNTDGSQALDGEEAATNLPMPLLSAVVQECAKMAGFEVSQASE